ncbi:hypothetical protein DFQ27_002376, partial [Actinomortierella ambigua]
CASIVDSESGTGETTGFGGQDVIVIDSDDERILDDDVIIVDGSSDDESLPASVLAVADYGDPTLMPLGQPIAVHDGMNCSLTFRHNTTCSMIGAVNQMKMLSREIHCRGVLRNQLRRFNISTLVEWTEFVPIVKPSILR